MRYFASAEIYKPAYPAFNWVMKRVDAYLKEALAASSLAVLDCKVRYIPIVMPAGMRERYPARSKLRKKERLYDCCPQLGYETFVSGDTSAQLAEYISGLREAVPFLTKLGASPPQVTEFSSILDAAPGRILTS